MLIGEQIDENIKSIELNNKNLEILFVFLMDLRKDESLRPNFQNTIFPSTSQKTKP